jgi:hypothetical protein
VEILMLRRAIILSILAALATPAGAAPDPAPEYQVKAAFLFKFGDFIDWPRAAFAAPDSPAVVCVLGEDPFGENLDKTVAGKRIGDRTIMVRRVTRVGDSAGCHILFIAPKQDTPATMSALRGTNVLTVTDAAPATNAGIINFVIKDNHVRFEIDDAAASANGLGISSKLLSLAVSMKPRG